MNEEDRRYLTEWGGDCWHEFDWAVGGRRCKKCGEWDLENRTFDTWEDFGWLWEKMIALNLIFPFIDWIGEWIHKAPTTRCQLICDFLREQEGKE